MAGHLDPESLEAAQLALDEASCELPLPGSAPALRTVLAKHLLAVALEGQNDPSQLKETALKRMIAEAISATMRRSTWDN